MTEWSDDEIALLREVWPSLGSAGVTQFPGRTARAMRSKAKTLRIKYVAKGVPRKSNRASPGMGRHPLSETFCKLPGGRVRSVFELGAAL